MCIWKFVETEAEIHACFFSATAMLSVLKCRSLGRIRAHQRDFGSMGTSRIVLAIRKELWKKCQRVYSDLHHNLDRMKVIFTIIEL